MAKRVAAHVQGGPQSSPRSRVSAILLAAGSSSRMGEPKPLLRLGGQPLLVHALTALRSSRVLEILVVLGAETDRIRRQIPLDGTRVIVNPAYATGLSSSIRAGLRAVSPRAEAFLFVLADQPLVSPATINALIAREEATQARILVPTYNGVRGNPVILYRSLSPEIELITGDVGCRGVIMSHAAEVVEVPVDDPGILLDVDSPEDLQRIETALREGTPLGRLV